VSILDTDLYKVINTPLILPFFDLIDASFYSLQCNKQSCVISLLLRQLIVSPIVTRIPSFLVNV
jgi:hypothetical protein